MLAHELPTKSLKIGESELLNECLGIFYVKLFGSDKVIGKLQGSFRYNNISVRTASRPPFFGERIITVEAKAFPKFDVK